jgi:hypothetical protein
MENIIMGEIEQLGCPIPNHAIFLSSKIGPLSDDEERLILDFRKQKEEDAIRHKKPYVYIEAAYEWIKWAKKEGGVGLTFSTFVNDFGYECQYKWQSKKETFDAVAEIIRTTKAF